MNPYESEKLLSEYLLLHYGTGEQIFGGLPGPREALDFPARCVKELLEPVHVPSNATAMDIGCAVGGSTFELARHTSSVVGLDYSRSFIAAAQRLQKEGSHTGRMAQEGNLSAAFTVHVPAEIDRSRVRFAEGDAMAIDETETPKDVVLAANLICRLPEPMRFLSRLPALIKPGGQLLLTTPFTWLEEFTPRANWLGGRSEEGLRSFDALNAILEPDFELQLAKDLPFLIREHARKFQYGIALGSRWVRRGLG